MIDDTNVELAKSLKKRELPEELNTVLNSEKDRIKKLEVIRKFQDIFKAKEGEETREGHQGGEIHPVSIK